MRLDEPAPAPSALPAPTPVRLSRLPAEPSGHAAADEVRDELAKLRGDLGPFIQRLNDLSRSVEAFEDQALAGAASNFGVAGSPMVSRLMAELEAEGGAERYQALQSLLEELRGDPTDLRLLLRLSDDLPLVTRLLEVYLRALSLIEELQGAAKSPGS